MRLSDLDHEVRRRGVRRTVAKSLVVSGALVGGYFVLPTSVSTDGQVVLRISVSMVLLVLAVIWQLRGVMRAPVPELRAIEGMALGLSTLVVAFSLSYLAMSSNDPAAFSEPLGHVDALYFTLATLTTVGFGDISPVTTSARSAAIVQMVTDFVYIGIGIRLVALLTRQRLGRGEPPG